MKRLLENKKLVIVVLVVLFLFSLLISLHFYQEQEKRKEIEKDSIVLPEDLEFQNYSSLSDEEVYNIVNRQKNALRNLFYQSSVYELKEIDSSKSEEENKNLIVFDEQFLHSLYVLVSEDVYNEYYNQMTFLKSDLNHQFYVTDRDIFESIYTNSALAEIEIDSSELHLIMADDDSIHASVTMKYSGVSDSVSVPFELIKVGDLWKINVF